MDVSRGIHQSHETVMCCKKKVERLGARAFALEPALQELHKLLSVSKKGVDAAIVQSVACAVMPLAKVCR
jgi:hypothetical protein